MLAIRRDWILADVLLTGCARNAGDSHYRSAHGLVFLGWTTLMVAQVIMQETARTQFPMAYVLAKGDLATVRDRYTRVIKSLGHRSLRAFITSSEWVDGALVQERFTAALATFAAALTVLLTSWACTGCSRIP
jgi:hypothetical protein